jgi:phosphatidylinositol alpha-mannosyltransferase
MRIAVTNPTTWPYLRRGAERFMNELAAYLSQKGHEVTIISGKPGRTQVRRECAGYTTVCHRRLWHPAFAAIGIREHHAFFLPALLALLRGRYDLVVSCQYIDAYAARLGRAITGTPYVFAFLGIPPRVRDYRSLTAGGAVIRGAVLGADAVLAASKYVDDYIQERWRKPTVRIPLPVNERLYAVPEQREHRRPVILCAAALDEPRKGGRLLMRAFNRLKATRAEPILQIAFPLGRHVRDSLVQLIEPQWRSDVQFLDAGEEVSQLYGQAAISVLPSLWEAYGLVVMESMAAGTPVVGARSGALPELIATPDIGCLFEPGDEPSPEPTNVDGLAQALAACLDLSRRPETAARCRAHAQLVTWDKLGPSFESLFASLA